MDEMNAFEHQIASVVQQTSRSPRPVDVMSIVRTTTTQSPKWRLQSMFSATKFVVAGVIVALFGGFLLTGVLTQQPSDVQPPAVGASASAQAEPTAGVTSEPEPSAEVEADGTTTTPELLPGVDLVTEEVEPGVYRVLSDGIRDLTNGVGRVTVTPEGDAWIWMGVRNDWSLVQLGEPGVSQKANRWKPWRLGLTADGAPVTARKSGNRGGARVFDGEAWQKTDLTPCDNCVRSSLVGADGGCYTARSTDGEEVIRRIDPDDSQTLYTRSMLGLDPDQSADFRSANFLSVGPDGTIWFPVVRYPGLDGLVAFDGSAWSWVPYDDAFGGDGPIGGVVDMAVDADGVVWVGSPQGPILSWDGDSWTEHPLEVGRNDFLLPVRSWPNGTVWFGSDARWDGTTLSLAEPAIPWASASPPATAPDGSAWTVIEEQLYVVTPEAVAVTE
jgi:hypothetical protein